MKKNIIFNNKESKPLIRNGVLKSTALLYLKEALYKERYEDCAELIRIARDKDATQHEIRTVISEYLQGLKKNPSYEAGVKKSGRFTF